MDPFSAPEIGDPRATGTKLGNTSGTLSSAEKTMALAGLCGSVAALGYPARSELSIL